MVNVLEMLKLWNRNTLLPLDKIPECCGSCIHFTGSTDIYDVTSTICGNDCYVDVHAFFEPCECYERIDYEWVLKKYNGEIK